MRSCYRELIEMQERINTAGKPSDKVALKKVMEDKNWSALMVELERQKANDFDPHPKMEKLVALALKHFVDADADAAVARERGDTANDSKVMVFVQFRDCVDEIMERLKPHHPLIRPAPFVGQGIDKRGKKGITQKEQLQVRFVQFNEPHELINMWCRRSANSKKVNLTYWFRHLLVKRVSTLVKLTRLSVTTLKKARSGW